MSSHTPRHLDESAVAALYRQLLAGWNRRSAGEFAALSEVGNHLVGFDGSQMNGRAEIGAIKPGGISMRLWTLFLAAFLLTSLAGCGSGAALPAQATPTAGQATVTATFDMGGGGAGFAATIYAQEVTSGKTFHVFYPAGSHGGVVLPTSPPVSFTVDAPGTYVFYAVLINEDSYHFGATGCQVASDCPSSDLLALDVEPGGSYQVYIGDRSAQVPPTGVPVSVPWRR